MTTQKVGYQDLVLDSHLHGVTPDSSAEARQKAVEWGARYCCRLGRALRHASNRCIRFHELQTIDSYRWLL